VDGAATAREVEPEPTREQPPAEYYKEDGIEQSPEGPHCTGKATPALRVEIDLREKATRACYDLVSPERAGASGDINVTVRVSKTGQVAAAEATVDTLGVPAVTNCVLETLKKPFTDTPPRGGCAVFVIPLHLVSEAPPAESEATATE
jgi:hypothetical protein